MRKEDNNNNNWRGKLTQNLTVGKDGAGADKVEAAGKKTEPRSDRQMGCKQDQVDDKDEEADGSSGSGPGTVDHQVAGRVAWRVPVGDDGQDGIGEAKDGDDNVHDRQHVCERPARIGTKLPVGIQDNC